MKKIEICKSLGESFGNRFYNINVRNRFLDVSADEAINKLATFIRNKIADHDIIDDKNMYAEWIIKSYFKNMFSTYSLFSTFDSLKKIFNGHYVKITDIIKINFVRASGDYYTFVGSEEFTEDYLRIIDELVLSKLPTNNITAFHFISNSVVDDKDESYFVNCDIVEYLYKIKENQELKEFVYKSSRKCFIERNIKHHVKKDASYKDDYL